MEGNQLWEILFQNNTGKQTLFFLFNILVFFKNLPFCRRFESNLNLQGTAVPWERIANTVPDLNQLFVCFFYLSVTQIDKMNRWLRNNELGGPIPDVFGTLPNLQILYCLFWLFCGVGF